MKNNMTWIIKGDQIIHLELVSEIYKHFDRKHYIKFKLSDSITSLVFENEEKRDLAFVLIQSKLDPIKIDI